MGFLTGDPSQSSSSSSSTSTYGNQAFNPLMTAFQPTLQGGGSASNMMASILGLNGSTGVQAPTYQPWDTGYANPNGPGSGVVGGNTQNFTQVAPNQSTFTTGKGPPVTGTPMNPQYNSIPGTGKGFNGQPIGQAGSSLSSLLPVNVAPSTTYSPTTISDYGTGSLPALPALDGGGNLYNPPDLGYGSTGNLTDYGTPGIGDSTVYPSANPGTSLGSLIGGSSPGGGAPGSPGGLPSIAPGAGSPGGGVGDPTPTGTPNPYTTPTATNAHDALNNFANSTGMQFVLGQGTNAVDQGMAGKGMALSGDTLKQLEQYGQGVGQTYLNQYMQNMNNMTGAASNSGRDLAIAGSGGATSSSGSGTGTGEKPGLLQALGGGQGIGSAASSLLPFIL